MPELAEVALYARDLNRTVEGRVLSDCVFPNRKDWGEIIVREKIRKLLRTAIGQRINFSSAGKALYLKLQGGHDPLCEFRLGMTGAFSAQAPSQEKRRHAFLKMEFGDTTIFYLDHRRFGRVLVPQKLEYGLGGLVRGEKLKCFKITSVPPGFLTRKRISWLLGTGHLTGVGNYMANEALGRLKLSPFEPCRSLEEAKAILAVCQKIAAESFKEGGNSFASGYYSLHGKEGQYIHRCRFYGNPKIPKINFSGRPVFTTFPLK